MDVDSHDPSPVPKHHPGAATVGLAPEVAPNASVERRLLGALICRPGTFRLAASSRQWVDNLLATAVMSALGCGVVLSTEFLLIGLLAFFAPALWQRHAGWLAELFFVWYLAALAIGCFALTTRRVSVVGLCIVGAYVLSLLAFTW